MRKHLLRFKNQLIDITKCFPVTLGREGKIPIRGETVSRRHCIIDCYKSEDGEEVWLIDQSKNGTEVNGSLYLCSRKKPDERATRLSHGSRIKIGESAELIYLYEDVKATKDPKETR